MGIPTPKNLLFSKLFAENCIKMKEFGPPGASLASPHPHRSANEGLSVAGSNTTGGKQFAEINLPFTIKAIQK